VGLFNQTPLGLQPRIDLLIEVLPGGGELLLLLAQGFCFPGNFGILAGELLLKPFAVSSMNGAASDSVSLIS
jgi:hypothetical protein